MASDDREKKKKLRLLVLFMFLLIGYLSTEVQVEMIDGRQCYCEFQCRLFSKFEKQIYMLAVLTPSFVSNIFYLQYSPTAKRYVRKSNRQEHGLSKL